MKRIIAIWTILIFTILEVHGQTIKGWIKDADTKEPLPFATIGIKGTSHGTVANEDGYFELRALEDPSDLFVSFMGYGSVSLPIQAFNEQAKTIFLKPSSLTLKELVIRPMAPEDYIKRVVKNRIKALPQDSYSANAYYREKFKENDGYIAYNEGIFKFHFPTYQDSLANQYQLCLYETAKNPQELQFMKRKKDKKEERKRKKAEKKGEEYEDDDSDMIHVNFGGPKQILASQMGEETEDFMDSTKFKKFKYSFGTPQMYQDRELMVINFQSRGKTDHMRSEGKIYIDLKADALAGLEYDGELVIPILIEPILFAMGISISNPKIHKVTRMQYLDDYWYPDYQRIDADMNLTKRYMFAKNEESKFDIDQVLKVSDLKIGDTKQIPEDKRYNPEEKPEEQVYNDDDWEWEDFDRIMEEETIKP